MGFAILFHPAVRDDVSGIAKSMRERIGKAIETRLPTEPARYGKPLRGTLAGYWKLRVGDWRVVYAIRGKDVLVLAIQHQSRIYDELDNRLLPRITDNGPQHKAEVGLLSTGDKR
jgi:mRNA interferase RelE/StbE